MRRGRSEQDFPGLNLPRRMTCNPVLTTVENRLTSLVKNLANNLEERLANAPTPQVTKEMGRCLDLEDIIQKEETVGLKGEREVSEEGDDEGKVQ